VNRFTRQKLLIVNRKYFFKNILCMKTFYPHKRHNSKLRFCSTPSSTVSILIAETSLWTASQLGCFTTGETATNTHWIGGWAGHRDGLDFMVKG
jgi:hypothetical protein